MIWVCRANSTKALTLALSTCGTTGRNKIIHRAQFVSLQTVQVGRVVAGDENDRRLLETRPLANQRGRFKAVHVRHVDVQQNDGEVIPQQLAERFDAVAGLDDALAQFGQNGLVRQQLSRLVIDQQNVDDLRGTVVADGFLAQLAVDVMCDMRDRYQFQRCSQTRMSDTNCSVLTGLAM